MAIEKLFYYDLLTSENKSITASHEDAGFEGAYLTDKYPSTLWRKSAIAEFTLTVDFGAAIDIEGVVVVNCNFLSDDTHRLWQSSNNNFAAVIESETMTLVDRTVNQATRSDCHYVGSWDERYYRVRIDKASGTTTSAGLIYIAKKVYTVEKEHDQEGYNVDLDLQSSENYGDNIVSGHISRNVNNSRLIMTLPYRGISETQRDHFLEAARCPYVCILDDDGDIYYGKWELSPITWYGWDSGNKAFNVTVTFTEVYR